MRAKKYDPTSTKALMSTKSTNIPKRRSGGHAIIIRIDTQIVKHNPISAYLRIQESFPISTSKHDGFIIVVLSFWWNIDCAYDIIHSTNLHLTKGTVMEKYQFITLKEKPDLKNTAADWV